VSFKCWLYHRDELLTMFHCELRKCWRSIPKVAIKKLKEDDPAFSNTKNSDSRKNVDEGLLVRRECVPLEVMASSPSGSFQPLYRLVTTDQDYRRARLCSRSARSSSSASRPLRDQRVSRICLSVASPKQAMANVREASSRTCGYELGLTVSKQRDAGVCGVSEQVRSERQRCFACSWLASFGLGFTSCFFERSSGACSCQG
jgi:hypothetical protein